MRIQSIVLAFLVVVLFTHCDEKSSNKVDPCKDVTCSGHGTCAVNAEREAFCECDQGFIPHGLECQEDPCAGVDCDGNGECTIAEEDPPFALCACEEGYHEEEFVRCVENDPEDPCAGITCSGHGTCVADPETAHPLCECDEGYRRVGDTNCLEDEPGDPCEGVTCSGHGACVLHEVSQEPMCACDEGFVPLGLECVEEGICGNGALDEGEECDDGNDFDGDGCKADCTYSCADHSDCEQDGNACTIHTCEVVANGKMCQETQVTGACDDGDDCTGNDRCEAGSCIGDPMSFYYRDSDADNFGDPNEQICAEEAPEGYVDNQQDCCDTQANVYPGQVSFFGSSYTCGSNTPRWDYDCDGTDELRWIVKESCASATSEATCPDHQGWSLATINIPGCGANAMYSYCRWVGMSCMVVSTQSQTQQCR